MPTTAKTAAMPFAISLTLSSGIWMPPASRRSFKAPRIATHKRGLVNFWFIIHQPFINLIACSRSAIIIVFLSIGITGTTTGGMTGGTIIGGATGTGATTA